MNINILSMIYGKFQYFQHYISNIEDILYLSKSIINNNIR